MKVFGFSVPKHVFFGSGEIGKIPELARRAAESGGAVLVLTDKAVGASGIPAAMREKILATGCETILSDAVPQEPYTEDIDALVSSFSGKGVACIVAIGGGSVLDSAKFLSVLLGRGGNAGDLVNFGVTGKGLPCILVPTTAGTGSEATPNAIVAVRAKQLKVGVVSPFFVPDYVVLDPDITRTLPPALTASTGVDAYCHVLECFISKKANPYSDMVALEGIRLLDRSIRKAYRDGGDLDARADMLLGAFYGGLSIASSGTTAVHALSYPLGGKYRIPHGVANAVLLYPVMDFNKDAISEKLLLVARAIGLAKDGDARASSEAVVGRLKNMVEELKIPSSLSALGVPSSAIPELAENAFGVKRLLDNNPKPVSRADIEAIYERIQ